ncbi:MAG: xanthine dehydrogenase family protein molybdopterin-binding subunit [Dethiobacteria bacterium]|jgi:CO/xanthine dehydrogenase Mo-binding subunit
MSQIAAEELGASLNDINLVSADSELCPIDHGNWLSGGVFVTGQAVRLAAADIKRQILKFAAQWLEVEETELEIGNRQVYHRNNQKKTISLSELFINSIQSRNGDPIMGTGFCKPVPEVEHYPSLSKGTGRWTNAYSYSISIAEVEVDKGTGKIKLLKVTNADDCGFPINPIAVEGQVESQIVQAVGDALFEQIITDYGRTVNPTFTDYKIPGILDIPEEISTNHIITNDPNGPFGGKEVGECARSAVIAAIANAVYDAIGVRIKELPLTPEKIYQALAEKRE